MNTLKEAQHDAVEYARSQMFFGEGAGIRRRIIEAKVSDLAQKDPKYAQAFETALSKQSWADHAAKAVKERKRIDRGKSVKKNTKAVLTGNHRVASSSVIAGMILAGYVGYDKGYDKVVLAEVKKQYYKAKAWVIIKKNEAKAQRNAANVTTINR